MFQTNPEIAYVCVASGIVLIARGVHGFWRKTLKIRKTAGYPFKYEDLTLEQAPRLFWFSTWGTMLLGVFFLLLPFLFPLFS